MPTFNHPITIRLAQTNISSSVNWTVANATGNVGHEVSDGVYPSDGISQIPNILDDVKLYADPNNSKSSKQYTPIVAGNHANIQPPNHYKTRTDEHFVKCKLDSRKCNGKCGA